MFNIRQMPNMSCLVQDTLSYATKFCIIISMIGKKAWK